MTPVKFTQNVFVFVEKYHYENLLCKEVADNSKIFDLRGEVAKQVQKEPGQLVLIFGGKILKDEDTLETHNIKDNNSVHLVIKNQRQVCEKIDLALDRNKNQGFLTIYF